MNDTDIKYMKEAYKEAKKAYNISEVPIGAVIVLDNKIIGRGYNHKENSKNSLKHAEIIAINQACKSIDAWRLENATLYVTLEPCMMCAGAIINSRIKKVVFSLSDSKTGAITSIFNINNIKSNHKIEIKEGVLKEEVKALMDLFFKELRDGKHKQFKKE